MSRQKNTFKYEDIDSLSGLALRAALGQVVGLAEGEEPPPFEDDDAVFWPAFNYWLSGSDEVGQPMIFAYCRHRATKHIASIGFDKGEAPLFVGKSEKSMLEACCRVWLKVLYKLVEMRGRPN